MWVPGATRIERPDLPRGPYRNPAARKKLVLHGVQCPANTDLTNAARTHPTPPHLWGNPVLDQLLQNFPLDVSAMALRSPNNNDGAVQVELAMYSESPPDDTAWLDWVAERIVVPVRELVGIELIAPAFIPYPESYGASWVRFSRPTWVGFPGVCGHMHSPSPDDHGDPGALNVGRILTTARRIVAPPSNGAAWLTTVEA